MSFAVVERGEFLSRRLVARFGPAVDARWEPHVLILAPGVRLQPGLQCQTVLLPGDERHMAEHLCARVAVSYGLSGRDTITLSSREGQRMWVALQRELVRQDGTVLERQELPVRIPAGVDEVQLLALAGAMLLLGAQPWELDRL